MGLLYVMSKGAVEQLVRVLSKDLGARGITVNAVAPGPVDTPLFRAGKPPHMIKWIASMNPQNRIPMPDEISPIIAFLSREESGWVNGQVIGVNGVRKGRLIVHIVPNTGISGIRSIESLVQPSYTYS